MYKYRTAYTCNPYALGLEVFIKRKAPLKMGMGTSDIITITAISIYYNIL